MLSRACRNAACPALWGRIVNAVPKGMADSTLQAGRGSVCFVHHTPASLANPDNKPPPAGKDKNDPANVKHDENQQNDSDDSSDYAPGYYDDHGKGGRQEVGGGTQQNNPQERSKHSHQEPVKEDKYNKEEHGDPARAGAAGDDKSVSDSRERTTGLDGAASGESAGKPSTGGMPDQRSQSAGMPQPKAPPAAEEAGPYNPSEAETKSRAEEMLEKGEVKPGKPDPARPDEPHKYKYQ